MGIDLTSTEAKPSACICLDDKLEVIYYSFLETDENIITQVNLRSPAVIAIDAPLSLPSGLCCLEKICACQPKSLHKGRLCERQLAQIGIPCYFTTKESIIKPMVYRAIKLKDELNRQGCKVIEIYPYASKVRLFGKPMPPKTTPRGLAWLKQKLNYLLPSLGSHIGKFNHDLCDAAIAAYTGFLYAHGKTEAVGNTEEGMIYIPIDSCGRREGG